MPDQSTHVSAAVPQLLTDTQAFELLIARTDFPKIRLHDLRQTHASIALSAGTHPKIIAERLGHESPAFTMKQYAHVIPGMQAEAARQVADLVNNDRGPATDGTRAVTPR